MIPRLNWSGAQINFSLLRTYVRVVEVGNISAAARSLYIAQSAVSSQISSLNRLSGTTLLERLGGRWRTTAAGVMFYDRAREILALLEQAERDLADAAHRVSGRLFIGSTRSVAETFIADILQSLAGSNPGMRIAVKTGTASELERWLVNDEVEIGIAATPFSVQGFDTHAFAHDQIVAVLAKTSPLARHNELAFSALEGCPFVCFGRDSELRSLLEERLGERFDRLDLRAELNSNDAVVSCVERDIGFAFLPYRTARRWAACGMVAIVRIADVDLTQDVVAVTHQKHARSRVASDLIKRIAAYTIDDAGFTVVEPAAAAAEPHRLKAQSGRAS